MQIRGHETVVRMKLILFLLYSATSFFDFFSLSLEYENGHNFFFLTKNSKPDWSVEFMFSESMFSTVCNISVHILLIVV